ncbi:uncharacterized protein [Littorina saxatilis]|uniref:Uncharacterized protein n=1 Tax=Littorina saxatilis TaxID=31220 RepID=A0AAN9GJ03_9CAEN
MQINPVVKVGVDKKGQTSAMAKNMPLVLLAGFCFVLHVVSYGAHALPQAETSKLDRAVEAELQINPSSGSHDNEGRLGERLSCSAPNQVCNRTRCCQGLTCRYNSLYGFKVCKA